jgi:hypothetical protein
VTRVSLTVHLIGYRASKDEVFGYECSYKVHLKTIFMILKANVFYGHESALCLGPLMVILSQGYRALFHMIRTIFKVDRLAWT